MTESDREERSARLSSEHAFLSRRLFVLSDWKAQLIFWPLAVIGLALDLWSKSAVFSWLEQKPGNSFSIINGFFKLVMAVNSGGAFGIFSGRPYLLAAVSGIALVIILVVFFLSGSQQKLVHIALALFAAGICGNLYDRIFNDGLVRDFIDVVYWPAFNIADSLLCIGVGLLIISTFWPPKRA